MHKKVIVIGGGLSGLSCGIYCRYNNFETTILEKNDSVGGFCTGWMRKGQNLDGCIHWLSGTKNKRLCNQEWKEIGAFQSNEELISLESWGNFDYNGTVVRFLKDINQAQKEWISISKEDKRRIKRFFRTVRSFTRVNLPMNRPISRLTPWQILKTGWQVMTHPSYLYTMKMSTDKYAEKFHHPALKWALKNAQEGPGNLFSMLFSYSTIVGDDGRLPMGGSKAFIEKIKDNYISNEGKLMCNADVEEIIIKNNKAIGVHLKDGRDIYGDYIVTALDPHFVYSHLLNNRYQNRKLTKRAMDYHNYPTTTSVLAYFDIENLKSIPIPYTFLCDPIKIGDRYMHHITMRSYGYDPNTFVKNNRTVVGVQIQLFDEDYFAWQKIHQTSDELYLKEKQRVAEEIMHAIEKQIPSTQGKIRILDVATPITLNRYTNAIRGTYMGYLFTEKKARYSSGNKSKDVKNLFIAGQWNQSPGGLPFALTQGKYAAYYICKQEKLHFYSQPNLIGQKDSVKIIH